MAGLLDYLYDPSTYGGQSGGLLSRLMPNIGAIPQSQGFPQQDQASPMSIGGYQMPRIGNPDQFQPQQVMTPPNATPTQGQIPQGQQQLPPALGGNSFGGNLGAGLQNFVNAGGPLQALAGGLTGLFTGQRTDPQGIAQANLKAQYDSLVPVLGPQKALLAVMNPEAGKTLLSEALTNKSDWGVVEDNPITGKKYGWIDKVNQTINGGKPNETPSGAGNGGPGAVLAQGVTFDPNKSGDDYLKQFSPELQAAVKDYLAGNAIPTGNQRMQSISSYAKTVAQKYASDMGIPFSDALYSEKRKYRTELGSNSANSAGGQAKAFNQGISHLSDLATTLEKLDNSNGFGIPIVAQGINAVRQGASNEQSAISDEAKSIGQTVAGEVGKLFSGSAGGGVHERELTRERFDTIKSKPQLAAALRATIETMRGGLAALEQNRDRILGPNSGVDFVGEETRAKIAKIEDTINRLEGKASAAPTKSGGLPSGWSVQVR